jgi:hypothetical protein
VASPRPGVRFARMPQVVISFLDGEILHAEMPDITFELAVLEAEFRSVDPNAERALFATSAIRQIMVGNATPAPPHDELERWDRAAFHFSDGQVLRASIAPEATLGRHGGVWRIVEPGSEEVVTVAIPYTALKGVFHIRQWDSRPLSERDEDARLDQLARVLAERESGGGAPAPPRRALLARMRRPGAAPDNPNEA